MSGQEARLAEAVGLPEEGVSRMTRRAVALVGLAVVSLLVVGIGLAPTVAAGKAVKPAVPCTDPRGCPDLFVWDTYLRQHYIEHDTFTATDCDVVEFGEPVGARVLLRFYSVTPNIGAGDLIVGSVYDHPDWFVYSACHNHYHFKEYADYRLWTPSGYAAFQALRARFPDALARDLLGGHPEIASQMVSGHKMGFCVVDLGVYPFTDFAPDPGKYDNCTTNQGISRGWFDAYAAPLGGQYIDVTGLAPGTYVLEDEVNAEHFFAESNYRNNAMAVTVGIP